MAKLTVKLEIFATKQKQGWLVKANRANKCIKTTWVFDFYLVFGTVFSKV